MKSLTRVQIETLSSSYETSIIDILVKVIKEVEWVGTIGDRGEHVLDACPMCRQLKPIDNPSFPKAHGHLANCPISIVLKPRT